MVILCLLTRRSLKMRELGLHVVISLAVHVLQVHAALGKSNPSPGPCTSSGLACVDSVPGIGSGGTCGCTLEVTSPLAEEGLDEELQLVGFHPRHVFGGEDVDDPGNFANRSPHPALHLLRQPSVTAAVDAHENSLDVPRSNQALLRRLGSAALEAELRRARDDAAREAG